MAALSGQPGLLARVEAEAIADELIGSCSALERFRLAARRL
jgi:hypothetical protein